MRVNLMAKDIVVQLKDLGDTTSRTEGRSTIYGAVTEITQLRVEVDRWKSLCERAMAYQLGLSDWQDIRISYDMALEDHNAQRSS